MPSKNRPEEGSNDFKLTLQIKKTRTEMEERIQKDEKTGEEVPVTVERRFVSGLASGVGVDLENERMATSAIDAMKSAIETGVTNPDGTWGMIPLRSGHRNEWDDILGYVTSAEIDKDYNLWIEAELEDTHAADDLYKTLTRKAAPGREKKLGLSIAGRVLSASEEIDMSTLERRRVFNEVALREISVVGQPAYPTAFLEAMSKSVDWDNPPLNLSREMPAMEDGVGKKVDESTEKKDANAAETPQTDPQTNTEGTEHQAATPETPAAPAGAAEKSVEPDADAEIRQIVAQKKAEKAIEDQVPDEIKQASKEAKAAKAAAAQPTGDVTQKDAASDALDEVDDAMDDALIGAMKATYDQLTNLVAQAKALIDASNGGNDEGSEGADPVADLVEDAQDEALIATVRQINDQICTAASALRTLFRADDAVDSMVENGGYSYYWSKKEEAPDVAKDQTPQKEQTMDKEAVNTLVAEAVKSAVHAALEGQSEVIEKMAKKIEELEAAPVDKSISVASAKEGEAQVDPREALRKQWEGKVTNGNGNQIIKSALESIFLPKGDAKE